MRNYHREMWFKEQERLKKGEDEFEVEAERRPDVSAETVGQVMSGADQTEDEVDPYYAEYRRQRRRNRGRSLSEPVPLSPLMQDKVRLFCLHTFSASDDSTICGFTIYSVVEQKT